MADIDLKTETPDTTLPTDGFLFGADSQSAASPSVYPVANAITTFVGNLQSSDLLAWNSDTFLARRAAANLQLGAADAAAPVAQTLSVQSVVAGTSNTAGADLTIAGSQGTGTGAGGSIVFQVAPAGASGTAQNALTSALALRSLTKATELFGPLIWNVGQAPAAPPNDPANAIHCTNAMYFTQNYAIRFATYNGGELNLGSGGALTWNSGSIPGISANDIFLRRDAANTLALRNGTNAQESRIYGSYTSATNFQRLSIKTLRESSGALSGASYTTTIAIPAYAHLIGVTTRVTTEVTGATDYDVGDGSDVDLWGAAIGVAVGSESRTADFTNIAAVGPAATSRTVTLTANGSNFTAGVIEICLHYLTTEAD